MNSIANQIRRQVQLVGGDLKYQVTTTIIDKGDLPFFQWFVAQIIDPLDEKKDVLVRVAAPYDLRTFDSLLYVKADSADIRYDGSDVFVRVANINDITEMPRDRVVAVEHGLRYFLTSTVTLYYTNLATANAAWVTMLDRLSDLVLQYRKYRDEFSTTPSISYTLPRTGQSVEDQYIAAYTSAKQGTQSAKEARDAAQLAYTQCATDGTTQASTLALLTALVSRLEAARQKVQVLTETGSLVGGVYTVAPTIAFNNVVKTFVLNAGDPISYESMLIDYRAQLAAAQSTYAVHMEQCAQRQQVLQAAEAVVRTTETAESAALANVMRVCPTFDPRTVEV